MNQENHIQEATDRVSTHSSNIDKWSALPLVMVRLPALKPQILSDLPGDQVGLVNALWSIPDVAQAIRTDNPTLARLFNTIEGKTPKQQEKLAGSLLRYALRMTTRPTPRGQFAGTAFIEWGDEPLRTCEVKFHSIERTAPAVSAALSRQIEQSHTPFEGLEVCLNPSTDLNSSVRNILFQPPGMAFARSIPLPQFVKETLKNLRFPRTYVEAVDILSAEADKTHGEKRLWEFINIGLLVTSLRPTAPHYSPKSPDESSMLAPSESHASRSNWFNPIDNSSIADSILTAGQFGGKSEDEKSDSDTRPIETDLLAEIPGQLSNELRRKLAFLAGIVERIGRARPSDPAVVLYSNAFAERFAHEEIPLFTLLDPVVGLGALPEPQGKGKEPEYDELRMELLRRAGSGGAAFLKIEDVVALPALSRFAPSSCDLFVEVTGLESNAPHIGLSPRGIVSPAGRSYSRFAHLDTRVADHMSGVAASFEESNTRVATVDYWHDAMMGLATGSATTHDSVILWSSTGLSSSLVPIRPDELVVGHDAGRLYIRSLRDNRRVIVLPHHLIDMSSAPHALEFLTRISADLYSSGSWSWGELERTHLHLPEISIEGMTLVPEKWRVPTFLNPKDEKQIGASIDEWRKHWEVPRYIRLNDGDLGIILDLENTQHQRLLATDDDIRWVERTKCALHDQSVEIVASFNNTTSSFDLPALPMRSNEVMEPSLLLPGEHWWSVHLRTFDRNNEEKILKTLASYFDTNNICWFFVRYNNPNQHLRVRVREGGSNITQICEAFRLICRKSGAPSFTIEPYFPEPGRVGGRKTFEHCQVLFCLDSKITAQHSRREYFEPSLGHKLSQLDDISVAALVLQHYLRMLNGAGLSSEASARILRAIASNKVTGTVGTGNSRDTRRKEHGQRASLAMILKLDSKPDARDRKTHNQIRKLLRTILQGDQQEAIGRSLTHLHLNRQGISPTDETAAAVRLLAIEHSVTRSSAIL